MKIIQNKVTPEFKKWVGYCEKNSSAQVDTYDKPVIKTIRSLPNCINKKQESISRDSHGAIAYLTQF